MEQSSKSSTLKPLEEIGDQWFINRAEYLDFFWKWANSIPLPGGFSIAFAGLRRTGKTAILHRVFNRLFNEQNRVMPVFITLPRSWWGAVMKGFDGRTLDGPRFFSTPDSVNAPRFRRIENRWGVLSDDSLKELDLIAKYQIFDSTDETWTRGAWFVQVKYQKEPVTRPKVEAFLEQIEAIQEVKSYDQVISWYVSKGGYFEPAKELLAESEIYYTNLTQFNELAREFGLLGFPEKGH